jgi:hypothetical protein
VVGSFDAIILKWCALLIFYPLSSSWGYSVDYKKVNRLIVPLSEYKLPIEMIIILSFESSVSFLDMLLILLRSLNNTPPLMSSIKEGHENSEVLTQLVLSCWRTLVQFTTSIPSNSRISLASWSSASTKGKRIVDSLNRLERWELCYQRCAWIVPTPTVSVFCRWVDSRIKKRKEVENGKRRTRLGMTLRTNKLFVRKVD